MKKPPAVLCDLDGTLCDLGDRDPYAGHLCETDILNAPVIAVVDALKEYCGWKVILLTPPNDSAREATERWLVQHCVHYDRLYTRNVNDWRPGHVYKREMYLGAIEPFFDVRLALEDDPAVVAMFRSLNVPCFHVDDFRHVERAAPEASAA